MGKNNVMRLCPKFSSCSAPLCPLDIDMKKRTRLVGEKNCTLSKNKRLLLGKDLLWKGLTKKEIAGEQIWNSRGESSKIATLQKLVSNRQKNKITSEFL